MKPRNPFWLTFLLCVAAGVFICGPARAMFPQLMPWVGNQGPRNTYRRPPSNPAPTAAQVAAQQAYSLNQQGIDAYDNGDYEAALKFFEEASEKAPDDTKFSDNVQKAQNQILAGEASVLNQRGIDAYKKGDFQAALVSFQEALEKTPDDGVLSDNVRNAQGQIAAIAEKEKRRKQEIFDKKKQEGISQLKDGPNDGVAGSGLKGLGDSGAISTGLKTLSDEGGDPMVVDARNVPTGLSKETEDWLKGYSTAPGVYDRLRRGWEAFRGNDLNVASAWFEDALNRDSGNPDLRYLVATMRRQRELLRSPVYNEAVEQGVAAVASGKAAEENSALERIRKSASTLVLPEDSDMALLFPNEPSEQEMLTGAALPVKDEQLNGLLGEHPELRTQLLAAWKNACDERERGESAALANSVRELQAATTRLGLPYGHIEETAAQDPKLEAQWQAAKEQAASRELLGEFDAMFAAENKFDNTLNRLQEAANQPANPYEPR